MFALQQNHMLTPLHSYTRVHSDKCADEYFEYKISIRNTAFLLLLTNYEYDALYMNTK